MAAAAALTPPEPAHAVPPSLVLPNASRARTESDTVRPQTVSTAAADAAGVPELPGPSQPPPPGSVGGGLLSQLPTGISLCRSAPGGLRAVPSAPDLCNTRAVPLPLATGAATVLPSTNDATTMAGQASSSPIIEKGSPPASLVPLATAAPATARTAGAGSSLTVSPPPTDSGAGKWAFFFSWPVARHSSRFTLPHRCNRCASASLASCCARTPACLCGQFRTFGGSCRARCRFCRDTTCTSRPATKTRTRQAPASHHDVPQACRSRRRPRFNVQRDRPQANALRGCDNEACQRAHEHLSAGGAAHDAKGHSSVAAALHSE